MLPPAHFHHEVPELPTISFLHLDCPYAQSKRTSGTLAGHSHREFTVPRPERHSPGVPRPRPDTEREYGS